MNPLGYRAIQRANPALGHFTDLKSAIMEERDEARIGGDDETMYKTYRLNMGTPELSREEMIVDVDDWAACVVPVAPAREGPVCIGIDIGQNKSMTGGGALLAELRTPGKHTALFPPARDSTFVAARTTSATVTWRWKSGASCGHSPVW